jgi:hypothetical protein
MGVPVFPSTDPTSVCVRLPALPLKVWHHPWTLEIFFFLKGETLEIPMTINHYIIWLFLNYAYMINI